MNSYTECLLISTDGSKKCFALERYYLLETIAQAMKLKRLRYSKTVMIARQNGEQYENHLENLKYKNGKLLRQRLDHGKTHAVTFQRT